MKKLSFFARIIVALFFISFGIVRLHAIFPFNDIKDTDPLIKPEERAYTPINGVAWWESGIIESLYRNGNDNDATIKLVRELFYLQRDGVTFDITTLNRKPAKYFKPSTVGKVINFIRQSNITEQTSEPSLQKTKGTLRTIIADDIGFDILAKHSKSKMSSEVKVLSEFDQKIQSLKNYNTQLVEQQKKLKAPLLSINARISNAEKAKHQAGISELQKEKESLDNQMKELEQTIEKNRKDFKAIESSSEYRKIVRVVHDEALTSKSLDDLVDLMVFSIRECSAANSIYLPSTTTQIFLAFLWKKVDEKRDFIDYFAACPEILVDPSWLTSPAKLELWLSQKYDEKDFEAFKAKTSTLSGKELAAFLMDNYELTIFAAIAHKVWDPILPPIISSIGESEFVKAGIVYKFANCAETALRNFINILLKKPKAITLDIDILRQTAKANDFTLNSNLVVFYTNNNAIAALGIRKVHNAFNQIVSDLGKDMVYLKPDPKHGICELRATLSNGLRALNYLLFNNDVEFKKMSKSDQLDTLCEKISRPGFSVTWEPENEDIDVNAVDFKLKIVFSINDDQAFMWNFQEKHALVIDIEAEEAEEFASIIFKALAETINPSDTNDLIRLNICASFIQKKQDTKIVDDLKTFIDRQVPSSYLYTLMNALYTTNDDTKTEVIDALIMLNSIVNSIMLNQFLEKLINSFSDPMYMEEALFKAVKKKVSYFYPAFKKLIAEAKKDPQEQGYMLVMSYCYNNLSGFDSDISSIIERIKPLPREDYPRGVLFDQEMNNALLNVLSAIVTARSEGLYGSIEKRAKDLTTRQRYFLLKSIVEKDVIKLHEFVISTIDALDQYELKDLGHVILINKLTNFYDILQQIINKITDQEEQKDLESKFKKLVSTGKPY